MIDMDAHALVCLELQCTVSEVKYDGLTIMKLVRHVYLVCINVSVKHFYRRCYLSGYVHILSLLLKSSNFTL